MINRFEPVLQFTYTCDLLTNCLRRGCRLVFYISPHRMLKFKLLLSLSIVVIINSFIHSSENTTFMFMDIIPTRLFPSPPSPSLPHPLPRHPVLFRRLQSQSNCSYRKFLFFVCRFADVKISFATLLPWAISINLRIAAVA